MRRDRWRARVRPAAAGAWPGRSDTDGRGLGAGRLDAARSRARRKNRGRSHHRRSAGAPPAFALRASACKPADERIVGAGGRLSASEDVRAASGERETVTTEQMQPAKKIYPGPGDAIRIVPMSLPEAMLGPAQPAVRAGPAMAPQLTYRNGPLLEAVEVFTIFWGSDWQSTALNAVPTWEALTSTTSHELCEAITDPVPGQGWYDDANGEIGDICAWKTKKVGDCTVQLEWSNKANQCL